MTPPASTPPAAVRRARLAPVLLACVALLGAGPTGGAAAPALDVDTLRAAFLFNVAKFVQWPTATGPLVICTIGEDPVGDLVQKLAPTQVVADRPVEGRRLREHESADGCHLLFVSETRNRAGLEILERTKDAPVLTVGETVQFYRAGGIVRLFIEQNRPRFQVDRRAAEARGLKISSKLLSLATP